MPSPSHFWAALPLALVACATPRFDAPSPDLAAANEAELQGDFERAVDLFAKAKARTPQSVDAWVGFGRTSLHCFDACVADPKKGNALFYLQDAEQAFRRAIDLDPARIDALVAASRIAREQAQGEAAARFAQQARDRIEKSSTAQERFDALLELGHARALEFGEAALRAASPIRQADLYQRAVEAYRSAAAVLPARTEPILALAQFEVGRGAVDEGLSILVAAAKANPEQAAYHQRLCDTALRLASAERLGSIYEDQLGDLAAASPTTAWYAGFVAVRKAEDARRKQSWDSARRAYDDAVLAFARSAEKNAAFAGSAKNWTARAIAGDARVLFDRRKFAESGDRLAEAIEKDPAALPELDGLGVSPKATALQLGGEYFNGGELEAGAKLFERWLALVPDDVDFLNNAGLFLRDLGEERARSGKNDDAMRCFEKSYACYAKVARLRPDEPRLLNDTALMLLYHLHRDLDAADAMFRRAIHLGEAKLSELGERPAAAEDASEAEKTAAAAAADSWDYFAEATGDAHQNLGLLLWQQGGDAAEIRKAFARALELDPRGTRGRMKRWIDSLPASGPAPKLTEPIR